MDNSSPQSSSKKHHVIVRGQISDTEIWIDFSTKKEKWQFIQCHLPDIASAIKLVAGVFEFMPPVLIVKADWLDSLNDVFITNQES